jgi:small-conductance mechanosensitive channel
MLRNVFDVAKLAPELRIGAERAAGAIAALILFWIVAKIAELLVARVSIRMPHNTGLLQLLGRTLKIAVITLGAATALGTIGVNVSALVAGLGLTGFALGFAFRDVLSNLLAGVLLLLFRPFGIDDEISVTGLEGRVVNIDLRYTVLRQSDKRVLIPNSNLFTNPILVMDKESGRNLGAESIPSKAASR